MCYGSQFPLGWGNPITDQWLTDCELSMIFTGLFIVDSISELRFIDLHSSLMPIRQISLRQVSAFVELISTPLLSSSALQSLVMFWLSTAFQSTLDFDANRGMFISHCSEVLELVQNDSGHQWNETELEKKNWSHLMILQFLDHEMPTRSQLWRICLTITMVRF
jgi:hypothetical protein